MDIKLDDGKKIHLIYFFSYLKYFLSKINSIITVVSRKRKARNC